MKVENGKEKVARCARYKGERRITANEGWFDRELRKGVNVTGLGACEEAFV